MNFILFSSTLVAEAMDFRDWCQSESVRLTGTKGIYHMASLPTCSIFYSNLIFGDLGISHRIRMFQLLVYNSSNAVIFFLFFFFVIRYQFPGILFEAIQIRG